MQTSIQTVIGRLDEIARHFTQLMDLAHSEEPLAVVRAATAVVIDELDDWLEAGVQ